MKRNHHVALTAMYISTTLLLSRHCQ